MNKKEILDFAGGYLGSVVAALGIYELGDAFKVDLTLCGGIEYAIKRAHVRDGEKDFKLIGALKEYDNKRRLCPYLGTNLFIAAWTGGLPGVGVSAVVYGLTFTYDACILLDDKGKEKDNVKTND